MFDQRKTVERWEMGKKWDKLCGEKINNYMKIPESERSLRPDWKAKET